MALIVDLFIRIDWIRTYWSWKLSSGVIANCLWDVPKREILIFSPHRFVEDCGKGAGWVFRIFSSIYCFSWSKISFKLILKSFLKFWLVCIIFILSEFIDPGTCNRVWLKIVSGTYPNWTHGFSPPAGFWKVVARVPVFYFTCSNKYIDWIQVSSSSYSSLELCR